MLDFYFVPSGDIRKLFVNFICYFVKFALHLHCIRVQSTIIKQN